MEKRGLGIRPSEGNRAKREKTAKKKDRTESRDKIFYNNKEKKYIVSALLGTWTLKSLEREIGKNTKDRIKRKKAPKLKTAPKRGTLKFQAERYKLPRKNLWREKGRRCQPRRYELICKWFSLVSF